MFSEEKLKICKGYITDYCNGKGINDNIEFIKAATGIHSENFFALFEIMDQKILKVKDNRLSSLLKNLTERVSKKWIKHLS